MSPKKEVGNGRASRREPKIQSKKGRSQFPESVQDQLNAVFICFASVVHHAQQFEEVLERFLTTYNRVTSDSVTVADMGSSKSIGLIVSKTRKHARKHEKVRYFSTRKLLATTLREKRYLLHRFFIKREAEFDSARGRRLLMAELLRIERNLVRSRIALGSMETSIWQDNLYYLPTAGIQDGSPERQGCE